MLAKDDDWLTAGNQLDDSLLMDDLWDDDADPQNDKGAASHSTGSAVSTGQCGNASTESRGYRE